MANVQTERIAEWAGGTLSQLLSMAEGEAFPMRIEVLVPGSRGGKAGEIHILAGGIADAFAGSLRRDDAVSALGRIEGARFLVEVCLPNAETGSFAEPAPDRGSLAEKTVAALMRYCEEYVLTCQVELRQGDERALIRYRKGELTGTEVNGSDAPERLPEVLAWNQGTYVIQLPQITGTRPITPAAPPAGERKRHSTLPLIPEAELFQGTSLPPPSSSPDRARPVPRSPVSQANRPASAPPPSKPTDLSLFSPPVGKPSLPSPSPAGKPSMASPLPPPPPMGASPNRPVPPPIRPTPVAPPRILPTPVAPPSVRPAAVASPPQPPPQVVFSNQSAPPPLAHSAQPLPKVAPSTTQPAAKVAASNDLKPASGVIASRPSQKPLSPVPATPVEVLVASPPQPILPSVKGPKTPAIVRVPSPVAHPSKAKHGRPSRSARRIRILILSGLAVLVGALLSTWVYWYLLFDRH